MGLNLTRLLSFSRCFAVSLLKAKRGGVTGRVYSV